MRPQCRRALGDAAPTDGMPTLQLHPERIRAGVTLAELAVEGRLAAPRSAARRLATGSGLHGWATGGKAVQEGGGREWRQPAGRKRRLRIALAD